MKTRIASLTILCMVLAAAPVSAQVLYDNGPINGTTNAWTINFGYATSDTFTLSTYSPLGSLNFGVWEFSGDTLTSVDWSITSQADNGTVYANGTASGSHLTDQFISVNQYGYNIDKITVTGLNIGLAGGTYWLNLQNAVVPSGDPVFWDENSGAGCKGDDGVGGGCPSKAQSTCFECDNIPSEAFVINGKNGGTVPEPGSFVLFGSGILSVVGIIRRKLWR